MLKIIVFPSESQALKIIENIISGDEIVIISRKQIRKEHKNVLFIKPEDEEVIKELKTRKARLLCCHEEGIYWLRVNYSHLWEIGFKADYMNILTKRKFKEFLLDNNFITAETRKLDTDYPVIVKPDIGFGSVGIKLLNTPDELIEYAYKFQEMIGKSVLSKYHGLYF